MSDPNFDGRKAEPYDFREGGAVIPSGTRIFMILNDPVVVPGPNGTSRVFIHPDDIEMVREANK